MQTIRKYQPMNPKLLFTLLSLVVVEAAPLKRRTFGLHAKKLAFLNGLYGGNDNASSNTNANTNNNNNVNINNNSNFNSNTNNMYSNNVMSNNGQSRTVVTTTNLCNGVPCDMAFPPCAGGSCGMPPPPVYIPPPTFIPPSYVRTTSHEHASHRYLWQRRRPRILWNAPQQWLQPRRSLLRW
ncbi:hypothetical protein DSO57_1006586 [Entomophthora muscae]|uniref:Uncharacterized protein n=1 Tax=Entomophthora muscae TaxID=34485 RepID=A0ACC2SKB0_9FUNG|nr:hypothetical protein DSO57_1006586 [Entomophthora muscae]